MAIIQSEKQEQLFTLIKSPAKFVMAFGGSRSGKTFGFAHACLVRAIVNPGSRIGVFRSTLKDCREKLFELTFPQVFEAHTPGLWAKCDVRISDSTVTLPDDLGGSKIIFGGCDDDRRLESILGDEFNTIYVNEVSQIHQFKPIEMMMTRMSQKITRKDGVQATPKMFFDCNPPSSKHWAYKAWVDMINPVTGRPHPRPENWASLLMNPADNAAHLGDDYFDIMENMSDSMRRRMVEGLWQTEVDGALFFMEDIDGKRVDKAPADLMRIVVAVDPAISANIGSDETGIVVAAIDEDGHGYILDDRSSKGTPETWAKAVSQAYEDWSADLVVYEKNQGGLWVETTLRSAGFANLPLKGVHASKGKYIRAEPISSLYQRGKVSHVGEFAQLEDQMANFTQDFNRKKGGSPDRLDALVWALTELMTEKQHEPSAMIVQSAPGVWA